MEIDFKNQVAQRDPSNGYEGVADDFIAYRSRHSTIGIDIVRKWARSLPSHSTVLDLGCGPGVPLSQTLLDEGCQVYGVDASPKMIAAFRERFPGAPTECASALTSRFFDRTFDGVHSWGLLFLLTPDEQAALIAKVAKSLVPSGQFLFTAPWQAHEWDDVMTRQRSYSLGAAGYRRLIEEAGMTLVGDDIDEGDNYYYFAQRS